MADAAARFALFVSCNEAAGPVTRFGTRTIIGGARNAKDPTRVEFTPELVVAIPHDEYNRYRREYDRALSNKSLVRRSVKQWRQQNQQREGTPSPPETAAAPAAQPSAGDVNADPRRSP